MLLSRFLSEEFNIYLSVALRDSFVLAFWVFFYLAIFLHNSLIFFYVPPQWKPCWSIQTTLTLDGSLSVSELIDTNCREASVSLCSSFFLKDFKEVRTSVESLGFQLFLYLIIRTCIQFVWEPGDAKLSLIGKATSSKVPSFPLNCRTGRSFINFSDI